MPCPRIFLKVPAGVSVGVLGRVRRARGHVCDMSVGVCVDVSAGVSVGLALGVSVDASVGVFVGVSLGVPWVLPWALPCYLLWVSMDVAVIPAVVVDRRDRGSCRGCFRPPICGYPRTFPWTSRCVVSWACSWVCPWALPWVLRWTCT